MHPHYPNPGRRTQAESVQTQSELPLSRCTVPRYSGVLFDPIPENNRDPGSRHHTGCTIRLSSPRWHAANSLSSPKHQSGPMCQVIHRIPHLYYANGLECTGRGGPKKSDSAYKWISGLIYAMLMATISGGNHDQAAPMNFIHHYLTIESVVSSHKRRQDDLGALPGDGNPEY